MKIHLIITKYILSFLVVFSLINAANSALAQYASPQVAPVTNPPGAPGPVTGPNSVLMGSTSTYTVTLATGATIYNWSLSPSNAGTISSSGGTTATVHWGSTYTGGTYVICYAENSKGSTEAPVLYVAVTQPVTPLISGTISPTLQNINNNATPATLVSTPCSGGNGIYGYQWQSSVNNTTWISISGAAGTSYTPSSQTTSTYYRLVTTSGSASVNSNTAFINTMVTNSYSPSNNIVSVNESTGTANVIIPLYTIKAAHVTFPINLIYSATGVKGTDLEGNAGMGWNVSLGGAVTRQLRGLPDDVSVDNNGNAVLGWLYNINGIYVNGLSFINDNNTSTCNDETTDINMINGTIAPNTDTEPDVFQVNAPGLSCQLIFDSNHKIQVIPYQDLKVTYTTSASGNSDQGQITSFIITNDKGITYLFSATATTTQKATTTQSSVNYFQSNYNHYKNGITYYNSWGLTSISDVHYNSIIINYTTNSSVSFSNPVQLSVGGAALTTMYTMAGSSNSKIVSSIACQNTVSGIGQTFNITYSTAPDAKKCIAAFSGMGHNITFGYNSATSTAQSFVRFFLNNVIDEQCSVQTVGSKTVSLSSYAPLNLTFNYSGVGNSLNTTTSLASPNSVNLDYWGYTNSPANNNASLLPSIDINPSTTGYERYRDRQYGGSPASIYTYSINGANREADQNCITGSLSQINYPSGGYTSLSYEPNTYYDNTLQATVQGGGICVTEILDHDGIATDMDFIKTYGYTVNNIATSSGKAISLPTFAFTIPYNGTNTNSALWTSSTMVSPVDLSVEDHSILYTYVTETINNTGSTVYEYTVPASNWDTSAPNHPGWSPGGLPAWSQTITDVGRPQGTGGSCESEGVLRNDVNTYPFPPNLNYDFERSLLTNVLNYNNSGTLVSEADYSYITPEVPLYIAALKYDVNNYATNYAKYFIQTSAGPLVSQVINKLYDLTNVSPGAESTVAQTVTTTNTYNTAQYKLSKQVVQNSDGSANTLNIKYSKDYIISTSADTYTSNLVALQNDNLNVPIETYTQFTPVNSTQAVTTGADLVLYGTFPNQGAIVTGAPQISPIGPPTVPITESPGPAPLKHLKFISQSGVANFAPSTISSSNTFSYDSRYLVTENDLGYDFTGFLMSNDDGFQHVKTTIYDNLITFRTRANITNARYDEVGIDYPPFLIGYLSNKLINFTNPPYSYNFAYSPASPNNVAVSTLSRNGIQALSLPASQVLTKTLSKNAAAKNYIFSIWINSAVTGSFTVNATDGTNTSSKSFTFDASTGNLKYPTGFQFCTISVPVTNLTASSSITISFSANQNINCTDILTYPDVADIVTYSYDSNNNRIAETNANGVSTYHSYDGLGRLLYTYDQDDNIIERRTYVNTSAAINSAPSVNLTSSIYATNFVDGTVKGTETVNFSISIIGANTCTFNGQTIYTWNFGDGGTQTGTNLASVYHSYNGTNNQQFTATLTITSPDSPTPYTVSIVITLPPYHNV